MAFALSKMERRNGRLRRGKACLFGYLGKKLMALASAFATAIGMVISNYGFVCWGY